jgi:hypothetical protein
MVEAKSSVQHEVHVITCRSANLSLETFVNHSQGQNIDAYVHY